MVSRAGRVFALAIGLILVSLSSVRAQTQTGESGKVIDSLLKVVATAKEDTKKVNIYWKLATKYKISNQDSGIYFGRLGLVLAEKLDFKVGRGRMNQAIGQNFANKGELRQAQAYYLKSIDDFQDDSYDLGKVYAGLGGVYAAVGETDSALASRARALKLFNDIDSNLAAAEQYSEIGQIFYSKSDYSRAMDNYLNALRIYEHGQKNEYDIAVLSMNIGAVCADQANFVKTREYYKRAEGIFEKLSKGDKKYLIPFAECLNNEANFYKSQNRYDSALQLFQHSLEIFTAKENPLGVFTVKLNMGEVYLKLKDFKMALKNNLDALENAKELAGKDNMATVLGNLGEIYCAMAFDSSASKYGSKNENLKKGVDYLNKSLAMSKELDIKENIEEYSLQLSQACKALGNYKEAYENFVQYAAAKDSLNTIDSRKALTKFETEAKKELDEKQIQVDKLEVERKKNISIFLYIGMAVLVFIIGLVVRSNMKQNKSNKIITREKKRSDELLLNILPAEVAEELKEKGAADAKYFDEVTVFFSDFVGFTKVAERMTPQQLVNELDACFKGYDNIMTKYNIEKIKTVGDAYLAASGLPVNDPNHAEKIIKAALEIRDFQMERKKQLGDMTFDVRIGAHTGSVVAGIVGIKKFAYDIWGDTVNTAARMEQNSMPGKINISENTYHIVKDKFDCAFRGQIQAKNKGELNMYFVERKIDDDSDM